MPSPDALARLENWLVNHFDNPCQSLVILIFFNLLLMILYRSPFRRGEDYSGAPDGPLTQRHRRLDGDE